MPRLQGHAVSLCPHKACQRVHPWHHSRNGGPICDACNHVHLGEGVCHNSENRSHLCGCTGTKESVVNLCGGGA